MLCLWIFLGLFALFLGILLLRAALFRPKTAPVLSSEAEELEEEKAVSALQKLVRCRTVSRYNPAEEEDGEFEKLIALLPELYPEVFRVCSLERMPDRGLLFRWKGREEGDEEQCCKFLT